MFSENPYIIAAIDRISNLSKDIGSKIWKIHGEAINSKILEEPLSDTGRTTAQACISLWNGSCSFNLQDLLRYDYDKFTEFMEALASIRQPIANIFNVTASELIPPGGAIFGDVVIRNIKTDHSDQ